MESLLNFKPSQVDRAAAAGDAQVEQELSSLAKQLPLGSCPKRPAFGDMTNAKKPLQKQGKKKVAKKQFEKTSVQNLPEDEGHSLKKFLCKAASEEAPPNSGNFAKKDVIKDKEEMDHSLTLVDEMVTALKPMCSETTKVVLGDNSGQLGDFYANNEYAMDIFKYMREREEKFLLPDYMKNQPDITTEMRAVVVDWMVELQESSALSHDILYLAVKLLDHFLAKETIMKNSLQLLGCTAIFLASKFEECCLCSIDDFMYVCDYAYDKELFLSTEKRILIALQFDINIPTAYLFLRQCGKYINVNMEILTLACFICELTLQDYDFVQENASRLASACLLLALKMKKLSGWSLSLEHYTGYKAQDLYYLVKKLNFMLTYKNDEQLNAVRDKYSNRVFFEVAKIPPMNMRKLTEALQS